MNEQNQLTAQDGDIDEQLVAYLDGELDAEEAARIERRLADDPHFRARLVQLQRAWDMLDTLDRTEADDHFTQSTVAMVAVKAQDDLKVESHAGRRSRNAAWLALAIGGTAAAIVGFLMLQHRLDRPNRELVRDLPVIERIDEYRNIDSVEFLRQLHSEGLFAAEVDDGS